MLLVTFAVLFLVVLFVLKNGWPWNGKEIFQRNSGLTYGNATVEDLIKQDTDGDGVLDWEEGLWGLDPTKAETTPGTPDITVVNKLRAEGGFSLEDSGAYEENLTQTDKFSRELFSTVASLNQAGAIDQAGVDKIGESLSLQLQNSPQRKIYTLADIKTTADENKKSVQKYYDALNAIHDKNPITGNALDILQRALLENGDIDTAVLTELNSIINPIESSITAVLSVSVPQSLAKLHLNLLNAFEKMTENLSDIKLVESDPVVAMGAVSQYEESAESLFAAFAALTQVIDKKLNN